MPINNMDTLTRRAESALISGVIPVRIIENTLRGKVVAPGPVVKNVTTKSSNDRVNAIKPAPNNAGRSKGNVTCTKACHGVAPKSRAAFSHTGSILRSLARSTMITKIVNEDYCLILMDTKSESAPQ